MDLRTIDLKQNQIILGNKYALQERLGGGSFGQIFSVLHQENGAYVAAKLEKRSSNATLVKEAQVISDLRGQTGFPSLYDYGKEEGFNYIIISLLGWNLEKLFKSCHQKFSLKTVLMIADQVLTRIETLHNKNYVHRDIKPENFCLGRGSGNRNTFIIDFGLAKNYKDSTGKHIGFKENKGLVGTARYASLNAHEGAELSRRDDLESIGYMLIYFLAGKLPWQDLQCGGDKNLKYQKIAEMKKKVSIEELCRGLPSQFETYMTYCKNLEFMEDPDYKYLKKLFRILFVEMGYDFDFNYDWLDNPKSRNPLAADTHRNFVQRDLSPHEPKILELNNEIEALEKDNTRREKEKNRMRDNSTQDKRETSQGDELTPKIYGFSPFKGSPIASPKIEEPQSTRKRSVIPDSLIKNVSINSMYSSKNLNINFHTPIVQEVLTPELSMEDSFTIDKAGKILQFPERKRNTVCATGDQSTGLDNLESLVPNKTYIRGKTKTFSHPNSDYAKRSAFAKNHQPVQTQFKREAQRQPIGEDEGNLNESSICEGTSRNHIETLLSARNFITNKHP